MPKRITRISSIVPNIEGRLELLLRSIGSLIDQELPEGVEHEILVSYDSLSQSSAKETREALECQLPKTEHTVVRLLQRTTGVGGVAEARNLALREATGQAIYFLDDDDVALPGCLASLSERMCSSQAGFVAGDHKITEEDEQGNLLTCTEFSLSSTWLVYEQIHIKNMIPVGAYLIRRDLIRKGFNPALRTLEDWLFLLDNVRNGVVSLVDELVVDIRRARSRVAGHRNPAKYDPQFLRDNLLIYGLHPSAQLLEERTRRLQEIEKVTGRIASTSFLLAENDIPDPVPAIIEREGAKYLILNRQETIQKSIFHSGGFERHLAMLTCNLIEHTGKEGDIIDVGANQGTYALVVAKRLTQRKIRAYEAQRTVFMHLCANVLINHCTNVIPYHLAIGNHEKQGQAAQVPILDPYLENYTGSVSIDQDVVNRRRSIAGVVEPWDSATAFDEVRLLELDELLAETNVACIKIDVEGVELDVLKGAQQTLLANKPLLLLESWQLAEFTSSRIELLNFVQNHGYEIVDIASDVLAYDPDQLSSEVLAQCLTSSGLILR